MKTVFKFDFLGARIQIMEEKMKYSTKQQKMLLECLEENSDIFYTIDQLMELLHGKDIHIGRTTVYRGLERLQKEGAVLKVPSVEGAPAQYRFVCNEERKNYGRLVCLECGHTIPLQCGCIDHFVGHVLEEHGFEIDQSRTVMYGYCSRCRQNQK